MADLSLEERTVEEFEKKLTDKNIKKITRYMTQCIEGLQIEWALVNIITQEYPGRPISNSVSIHELREANEFEALGYNFASEDLEKMADEERWKIREERERKYIQIRGPHIQATIEQVYYLMDIARKRGYSLSPGTILHTILSTYDAKEMIDRDPCFKPIEEELGQAKMFASELLKDEPFYEKFFKIKKV